VQEEVARQHAQANAPGGMPVGPQSQPNHQPAPHQHMMTSPGNPPVSQVQVSQQFRGPPQMRPTPRLSNVPAGPGQVRHPGLPGMEQMQRYPGMPSTRPSGNLLQQQQQPSNIMMQQQPQPNQQNQQQPQPGNVIY